MNEIESIKNQELSVNGGIRKNPAMAYIASLTETGRKSQASALNKLAQLMGYEKQTIEVVRKNTSKKKLEESGEQTKYEMDVTYLSVPWETLEYEHMTAIRTKLMETYSVATTKKTLCAVRRVLKEAKRLGYISAQKYSELVDLDKVNGETLPAGRDIFDKEIRAIMKDCLKDKSKAGIRDGAIIALMVATGCRRSEITNLEYKDFAPDNNGHIVFHGKRNKDREFYLDNGGYDAMMDWLDIRGNDPGAMFYAIDKGDNINKNKGMTPQSIFWMLKKRAENAGIENLSPHDFRRTFITRRLEEGVDIALIAKIVGHSSTNTTARYDRRGEEAKKEVAGTIHVPYKRRRD